VTSSATAAARSGALLPCPVSFDGIPRAAWDRLFAATPAATPFSRWTFHRAWWDAYGGTAHEQYMVCLAADEASLQSQISPGDGAAIRAIVPLMHRHEVEPGDAETATILRRRVESGTSVRADAKAVFMAASYHADYATLLCSPDDVDAAAEALARACCEPIDPDHGDQAWDVIDLRRFRADDPALPALQAAFRRHAPEQGWDVRVEQEDVCPVVQLEGIATWDDYLATLDKKARHEIRRKLRRAEAAGPVRFELASLGPEAVDRFIELHQERWGEEGLFPHTEGGERSRRFLHRLAELEAGEGERAQLQIGSVSVGDRVIFATVGFDDGTTSYFYNAGMDPAARDLSPGVTGTAAYVRDRLEAGRRRFDFLRGPEPYKYEWGATDEPIYRLLVQRSYPQ
jgi:CelD/BcsL family acetyltransferase involved in cellulose biosynthesis